MDERPRVIIPVYILAGGRSSRFGSDKARATLDGSPLILRIAEQVKPIASRVAAVAGQADKYADLGLRTITDVRPERGPLGGLEAALLDLHDDEEWLLLLSCDLVTVRAAWVEALLTAPAADDTDAVAIRDDYGWEPLLALYHGRLLERVQSLLRTGGGGSMRELLDQSRTIVRPRPHDWPDVSQVNTREDLDRASGG